MDQQMELHKDRSEETWSEGFGTLRLFFEVKTEIPSVGELMRLLQMYRNSMTFRFRSEERVVSRLIVVAPPNNEAASVCQDHGIAFLEYREP